MDSCETTTSPTASIDADLTDGLSGLRFCDTFSLSFNVYFFRILKWLLAGPFLLMGGALLLAENLREALPLSF